ncbi:PIN domain-containing protein [Candidatus Woesearchaeota archaeon]|nr:PIN domain-containing protein [Candidatus Woesearchaeota archaeon]
MISFFFDTYAFYEIIVGNPNYKAYTKNARIITTQLNLMELYYQLILAYDKKTALELFKRYEELIAPISNGAIIEAMDFRKQHYKKRLSYVDCVGYIMAKNAGIPFLTGDRQFKEMPNVEFVK